MSASLTLTSLELRSRPDLVGVDGVLEVVRHWQAEPLAHYHDQRGIRRQGLS